MADDKPEKTSPQWIPKWIWFSFVPVKYRVPLQGKYCAGVYACVKCRYNIITKTKRLFKEGRGKGTNDVVYGFADLRGYTVRMWECPLCFTKQHNHASHNDITRFLLFRGEEKLLERFGNKHEKERKRIKGGKW